MESKNIRIWNSLPAYFFARFFRFCGKSFVYYGIFSSLYYLFFRVPYFGALFFTSKSVGYTVNGMKHAHTHTQPNSKIEASRQNYFMVESHSILPRSRTSDDAVKIYVPTYPLYVKSFDISRCANGRQEKKIQGPNQKFRKCDNSFWFIRVCPRDGTFAPKCENAGGKNT